MTIPLTASPPAAKVAPYAVMAAFRHALRGFLHFSEQAALAAGLTPQQHQALLAIAGHTGATPPSIGELAGQLRLAPHSAAELVARMVEAGLLDKHPDPADRRRQHLTLTEAAWGKLASLTEAHIQEAQGLAHLAEQVAQLAARLPGPLAAVPARPEA